MIAATERSNLLTILWPRRNGATERSLAPVTAETSREQIGRFAQQVGRGLLGIRRFPEIIRLARHQRQRRPANSLDCPAGLVSLSSAIVPRARLLLQATLLAIASSSLVLLQLGGPTIDRQIDADSAGFVLFVRDIVSRSAGLPDWHMGTHLYLFPDAALTAIALGVPAVGGSLHVGIISIIAACYILTFAAVWSVTFNATYWQSLLWSALALNVAYLLSFTVLGGWFETEMMAHLFAPSTHQGSILIACLALALMVQGASPARLLAIFLLVALTTMSDVIFVAWGAAPLIAAALTFGLSRPTAKLIVTITAATAAGLLGSTIITAQHETRMAYVAAGRLPLAQSVEDAAEFLRDGASFLTPSQGVLFYCNIGLWIAGAFCTIRAFRGRPITYGTEIIFISAASASCLLAATVTSLFQGIVTARYIMPYVVYNHFLIACVLIRLCSRSASAGPALSAASAAAALALYLKAPDPRSEQLANCLEQRHLTTGAAHYWDANPLLLAASSLHLLPLEPEASKAYAWNTNRKNLSIEHIQFVISTTRLMAQDVSSFGQLARVTPCANRLILEMH